jgi:hypothetical protein
LEKYICFFNSVEYAYLEQNESVSTRKQLSLSKYSFQKLTQFSQGNNVLDAPTSHTHDFLQEIHVFLQHSLTGLLETK